MNDYNYNRNNYITWQEYCVLFLIIGFFTFLVSFVVYEAVARKEYYYILDDYAIERKCVREVITVYRETYTDENGNVVLTIDRVKE